MSVQVSEAIFLRASNHTGLTNLIQDKCYKEVLPERVTLPAITYQLIASRKLTDSLQSTEVSLNDDSPQTNALVDTYQIKSIANTSDLATIVADQIRKAFDNWVYLPKKITLFREINRVTLPKETELNYFSESIDFEVHYYVM